MVEKARRITRAALISGISGKISGLVAGAMSMAAAEYVSVSSQADTEPLNQKGETDKDADPEDEWDQHVPRFHSELQSCMGQLYGIG